MMMNNKRPPERTEMIIEDESLEDDSGDERDEERAKLQSH